MRVVGRPSTVCAHTRAQDVGDEIIDDVVAWLLAKRIRDDERVLRRCKSQLSAWLLKVGANDRNMQNVGRARPDQAALF